MTREQVSEMLRENTRRKKEYFRKYNPVTGDAQGEVFPRIPFRMERETYHIPPEMMDEPLVKAYADCGGDARALLRRAQLDDTEENRRNVVTAIHQIRLKYDFEFWAAVAAKIQDKESKQYVPFILNRGQRILLRQYEDDRRNGRPIRVVLVKSRQWGGSTLTENWILWIQTYWRENWHSCIVAKDQTQATNIRSMMKNTIANLPPFHKNISLKRFENMDLIRYIPERGAKVQIGSAEEPDALRSFDFSMLHLSEVGLWKDTKEKTAADLVQSLYSTIPDEPYTMIVFESTAKGVGNFFYDQAMNAEENRKTGAPGFMPVFVAWWDIQRYTVDLHGRQGSVARHLTQYQMWQWEQGATLEGIEWWARCKKANNWNDFQMKSEYPTTMHEAFQTTSNKYFDDERLRILARLLREPSFVGDIMGRAPVGEDALQNIRLVENDSARDSRLQIWIMPDDGVQPNERVRNRFVVTVDVGGRGERSDRSVISVFDRLSLVDPSGAVERAALWYGHVDPDILAYKAVQVAKFYNDALLVIESNTYETKLRKRAEGDDAGNHSLTVLDVIGDLYGNMYRRRTSPDATSDRALHKLGWHMNKSTKYTAYDCYSIAVREEDYVEYSRDAYVEAEQLTTNSLGQIEAMQGCHDDMQDTTAVGVYIALNTMGPVVIVDTDEEKKKRRSSRRGGGVSSF